MLGKICLGISGLAFTGYGIVSLVDPTLPASMAGILTPSGDSYAEIGSIYGGLQPALGVFFLIALFNQRHYRSGLLALMLIMGSLAVARFIAMQVTNDPVSSYSWSALAFEAVIAMLTASAFFRANNDST